MIKNIRTWVVTVGLLVGTSVASGLDFLTVDEVGKPKAVILASATPGDTEVRTIADLVRYVEMMTGATLLLANTPDARRAALSGKQPVRPFIYLPEEAKQ